MEKIEKILAEMQAVMAGGHFVYKSGLHGDAYVNKDAVYTDVFYMEEIGGMIASEFPRPEAVLGPVVGGALLSQWVAYAFASQDIYSRPSTLAVYADKDGDDFIIRRGYDKLIVGKQVLVVEDILNTGGSAQKTIAAARAVGAEVIGVGAIVNRGGVTADDLGVPSLHSLLDINLRTYAPEDCPLCVTGVPVNEDVGHGKEYMERKRGAHRIEGGMPPLS